MHTLLFHGLIIWFALSMVAGMLVVLKNSALRDELESTKLILRSTSEILRVTRLDQTQLEHDLKAALGAWMDQHHQLGTKHGRRLLRAQLVSSRGQRLGL